MDGIEALEGKTGAYYVGVNVPDPDHYTVIPAKNSFTQAEAEYTYSGVGALTLSNFTIKSKGVNILNAVARTYSILINNIIKSTVVLTSTPYGQDVAIFTINPGDKIVIKATNPGNSLDISFEWSANIS